jgi:hypothetical protein
MSALLLLRYTRSATTTPKQMPNANAASSTRPRWRLSPILLFPLLSSGTMPAPARPLARPGQWVQLR